MPPMQIRVLMFAGLAHALGVREITLELLADTNVQSAINQLLKDHPDLQSHLPTLAFAVNCDFVKPEHVLSDGDELALIPPVSGG